MTPVTSAYRNLEWRISFIAKTYNFLLEILSCDKIKLPHSYSAAKFIALAWILPSCKDLTEKLKKPRKSDRTKILIPGNP